MTSALQFDFSILLSATFFLIVKDVQASFFWIDKGKAHSELAKKCLELMANLKQIMCDLFPSGASGPQNAESNDYLYGLPTHVQYACLYCFEHFSQAGDNQLCLGHQVDQFFQEHCLYWIEALRLMG